MKFNFKKIATVLASTVMLGSTLGFAAAANYPAPFISGGNADVAVVVGSIAQSSDYLAATQLGTSLQEELAAQTARSGGSTSTTSISGGDYVVLDKPSNNVNMGDTVSDVFGTSVTDDHLSTLLADGVYRDDANTEHDFEQKLTLASTLELTHFSDSDYDADETPTIGINISSGASILNYTLDFLDTPDWLTTTLETSDISLLGKSYYILDITNSSTSDYTMTLLDAANTAVVQEGETKSVTVGSKTYEVSISYISTTEVKLDVGGELTNSLAEGGTYKLSDGTYVGIKDILARDVAGTVGSVEFSIGSGKLEIKTANAVKLNDQDLTEITGYITVSSGDVDSIILEWKTDDEEFITPNSELLMPGFESLKIAMGPLVRGAGELTKVRGTGGTSGYILLDTTIKNADISLPILYANTTGEFAGLGKDSTHTLVSTNETELVIFNLTAGAEYMIASWNTTADAESYLLDINTISHSNGINETTIRVKDDSETDGWAEHTSKKIGDTVSLGSLTLTVDNIVRVGSKGSVRLNISSGGSFNTLYTATGVKIYLPYENDAKITATATATGAINFTNITAAGTAFPGHGWDTYYLSFEEEDKDGNVGKGNHFNVTLDDKSDHNLEVSTVTTASGNLEEVEDDDNTVSVVKSDLATQVRRLGDSSAQRSAEITYWGSEVYAEVILAEPGTIVSGDGETTSSGGTVGSLGVVTYRDSEVSQVSSKNLIVVGGSCVNTVAAKILGSDTPVCGEDFTALAGVTSGQFLLKVAASPYNANKVAMLVAGYDAEDTTSGVSYVVNEKPSSATGEMKLTRTTYQTVA